MPLTITPRRLLSTFSALPSRLLHHRSALLYLTHRLFARPHASLSHAHNPSLILAPSIAHTRISPSLSQPHSPPTTPARSPGDLAAARLARAGVNATQEDIENLRKDKKHAERLAKLAASANARGAAPAPPGKGGPAAPAPAPAGKPAEIVKYRAMEDFAGDDVSFEKGATIFIVGDPDSSGMAQVRMGVVGREREAKKKKKRARQRGQPPSAGA